MSQIESFQMSELAMSLRSFESALGDAVGEFEAIQFGLIAFETGIEHPDFIILFSEADDIGKDPPIVKVCCSFTELIEEG